MKREKLKSAQNPVYGFRVSSPEDKEWIEKQLEDLKKLLNKNKKPDERVINKNDIILEALKRGFDYLRSKHSK